MDKKYLITRMNGKIYSFLLHGQKAVEIHCDAEQTEYVLGNIYVGRIKNIAKNIGAAFVELAPGMICHLALDEMKCPVYTKKGASALPQAGDELLVQIAREGIKTKRPSVATKLTLHGKYVLLTVGTGRNSASAKLAGEEKRRLLSIAAAWDAGEAAEAELQEDTGKVSGKTAGAKAEIPGPAGKAVSLRSGGAAPGQEIPRSWLFRTNAQGASEELLRREMERLQRRYETLMAQAQYRTCFSCLYEMPAPYLLRLSNLYDADAGQILTDDEALHQEISLYLRERQPEDAAKLALYRDSLLSMKKLYSLETQLRQALQERVWLNSGGYLVIQPTEALTVVDVNTGKSESGKNREAAFLKINCEAAVEIARQLRLRNLSGIIIVDFINMDEETSKEKLLSVLDGELRKDPIRAVLVDMTKLSLVELTRQKKERPLAECVRGEGENILQSSVSISGRGKLIM